MGMEKLGIKEGQGQGHRVKAGWGWGRQIHALNEQKFSSYTPGHLCSTRALHIYHGDI